MKTSIYLFFLAALLLSGCSQKTNTTASGVTPVSGMSAKEVMVAHEVASEVLPARATHKNDPGLEAVDRQMAAIVSGLDSRTKLLMSEQALSQSATTTQAATESKLRQQLDGNATSLTSMLASARASVDDVGGSYKRVAGMSAESLQAGLRASMDRIAAQLQDILRAPPDKAIPEISALRARLTLAPLHSNGRAMPTISVRTIHP